MQYYLNTYLNTCNIQDFDQVALVFGVFIQCKVFYYNEYIRYLIATGILDSEEVSI